MRGRLAALGVTGVRASTFHSAALAQLRYFGPDAVGRILPSKALLAPQPRRRAAGAVQVPRRRRPRDRDRVGAEPADHAGALPRLARRPRAADPGRPDAARLRALRGGEARAGADRLRGPARARDRALRGRARRRRVPRALPRVHGRRVPGRQPAPADAARRAGSASATSSASSATTTSRSTASPARRRRTCSACRSASRTRRWSGWRRTTARRPRCSRSRTGSSRSSAARRRRCGRCCPAGPEPEVRPFATAEVEAAFLVERIRGAGCPLEEIAILCRTNARLADFEEVLPRPGIPSQGAALLAREAARRVLRALDPAAPAAQVRADRARAGLAAEPPDEARRARADAPERPGAARPARRGGRRHRRRLPRRARAPLRRRRRGAPRRPPAHLPRREGARVRGRLPAAARGEGAAGEGRRGRRPSSPRSGGSSTSGSRGRSASSRSRGSGSRAGSSSSSTRSGAAVAEPPQGFEALKAWRLARARRDDVPAYLVFHNSTLEEIAAGGRGASTSSPPCRASGRRSSSATARRS